jgi:hypothetical protein
VSRPPSTALVWFGVLGGAGAWLVQFLINLAFSLAQCNRHPGRWQLPVHGWEIGLSVAALAVGLSAEGVCVRLYRRTFRLDHIAAAERRGEGSPPPAGRISFLSMVGLTVNLLALTIIVMTGIGAPLLPVCQQS